MLLLLHAEPEAAHPDKHCYHPEEQENTATSLHMSTFPTVLTEKWKESPRSAEGNSEEEQPRANRRQKAGSAQEGEQRDELDGFLLFGGQKI
ncbi:uncharacterized protein MONOS_11050 [Monocercomonoides exilis]|uniref:uncharacterized protein n=1 Tax=Monocercomonoides exilis TaxID=2049356 RepID=UPI003559E3B1|nr:hypothetical protein MONOS_11050 [Monocercomonoides exilis]|eukprot:MONOS_11050.1-p1 / transcript=MONOS_11050.1 / gene=MONOS_11050 / organism=Monocercomonoides_exilis_PA203 / gene_product=unspecified product / transcript_product=unspecified product / location=Mono_scaffold00532:8470-8745(-) / protein_length=92 / sequence_SO=supercontig / SO=protein_coding / is_pseudo=false